MPLRYLVVPALGVEGVELGLMEVLTPLGFYNALLILAFMVFFAVIGLVACLLAFRGVKVGEGPKYDVFTGGEFEPPYFEPDKLYPSHKLFYLTVLVRSLGKAYELARRGLIDALYVGAIPRAFTRLGLVVRRIQSGDLRVYLVLMALLTLILLATWWVVG